MMMELTCILLRFIAVVSAAIVFYRVEEGTDIDLFRKKLDGQEVQSSRLSSERST